MSFDKAQLQELLREACSNVGEKGDVSMPAAVAEEFIRLALVRNESDLRTGAQILTPPLEMALAMGAINGPAQMVADIRRGYEILSKAK